MQDSIYGGFYANLIELKCDAVDLNGLILILNNFTTLTTFFDATSLDHVNFLFAAASLRAFQFGISTKGYDKFRMQEIAGNIVPAVCFSNGLVGALAVRSMLECAETFVLTNKNHPYIRLDSLSESSHDCTICGVPTWRVGLSEIHVFLAKYNSYSIYCDGKCVA